MSSTINASTASGGGVITSADASGILQLQTGGTTAVTIDASQNVTFAKAINKAALPTGSVLQVVSANYSTQTSTTSNVGTDTGLTATITPNFATSKILVLANITGLGKDTNNTFIALTLFRGASSIIGFEKQAGWTNSTASNGVGGSSTSYLDSPATTSATTYKVQFSSSSNLANVYVQLSGATSTITLMEIAA